jgi:hypothetical protein
MRRDSFTWQARADGCDGRPRVTGQPSAEAQNGIIEMWGYDEIYLVDTNGVTLSNRGTGFSRSRFVEKPLHLVA